MAARIFVARGLGRGKAAPQSPGSLTKSRGLIFEHAGRNPDIVKVDRPQCSRPGSSRWPVLRRKKVTRMRRFDRYA